MAHLSVMLLNGSRGTELPEDALGHSWEDARHGIDPLLVLGQKDF